MNVAEVRSRETRFPIEIELLREKRNLFSNLVDNYFKNERRETDGPLQLLLGNKRGTLQLLIHLSSITHIGKLRRIKLEIQQNARNLILVFIFINIIINRYEPSKNANLSQRAIFICMITVHYVAWQRTTEEPKEALKYNNTFLDVSLQRLLCQLIMSFNFKLGLMILRSGLTIHASTDFQLTIVYLFIYKGTAWRFIQ